MKNRKNTDKQAKHLMCELHSNLMLVTTTFAMLGFVVLMLIYMGMKNPTQSGLATSTAQVSGILSWIAAAVMAVRSVKSHKRFLCEYVVYLIIMGFGLTFMFNIPMMLMGLVYYRLHITNWAQLVHFGLSVVTGVFFAVSIIWHGILANPKRK